MPAIEVQNLNQKAVLWAASSYDNFGCYQVTSPVEIDCRWEESRKQSASPENTVIAIVATAFVDREIAAGSILWKGSLSDLPTSPTGLKEVVDYEEVPDLKGRNVQRTVTLARYNEQLPTVV
jgi:hypothetical protein